MREREPLLDGIRGLAILLVLAYHVGIFAGLNGRTGLDRFMQVAADQMWVGVDLFFVLSGFLITGILYTTKESVSYFRTFYGRRILRIFPLYYGFLVVAFLLFPLWLPPDEASHLAATQGWYWFYLSNVQVALHGWQEPLHLGHFWSLAVEEQFYLLWPLAVWALDRKWLMRLAVACFVGALALRLIKPFGLTDLAAHVLLPTRMDSLAAGAWLALYGRGERGLAAVGRWPVVIFATCVVTYVGLHVVPDPGEHLQPLVRAVRYTLIAAASGSLLAFALGRAPASRLRRAISSAPLVFLGKYSYGLYVVHVPTILFVARAGLDAGSLPEWSGSMLPGLVLFGLVGGGLSIACAVVLYHVWEEPFLRLKHRLPYRVPDPRPVALVLPSARGALRVAHERAP